MDNKLLKNAEQFKDIFSREIVIRKPSVKEENRAIRGVIATELPVIVMDWYRWEPVREVLMVDGGNIPDKVPLLDAHSRFEISNIKGSTTNFDYEADKELGMILVGDNVFSSTAEKEFTLAKEGHLDSTSIGYRVYDSESVRIESGKEFEIDGRVFRNDYPDKLPLVIRKKWDLMENSLVPIGADKAAKFRSMFSNDNNETIEHKTLLEEIKDANKELDNKLKIIITKEGRVKMDEEKKLADQQRVEAIDKLASQFADKVKGQDLKSLAELYKTGNKSEKEFSDMIFNNLEKQSSISKPAVDLTPKEVKNYSIARAMRSLISGERCFESEVSRDLEKVYGRAQGILIPHSILDAKRDLLAGTATAAAELVATDHLAGEFIDLLRNKMVFSGLGVRMLSGLKGNVEIPKWNSASTFGWAATEAANTSESTPATTEVTMSPKRGGAYVEASKTLLLQSSPSAESLIVDDLTKVIALAIDKAIAHGSGSNGQPTGIIASSPGSFSGASFSWQTALEAIADIETANADVPNMAFVSYPAARATLKARAKEAGYPVYIVGDDNTMAGYQFAATNQIDSGYMLFGDFSQAIVGMWGALDLVVDPYNKAEYGLVRFIAQQLIDVAVRHASAFTVCSDFS